MRKVIIESSRFKEGWYNRLDLETSVDSRLEASLVFDDNISKKGPGEICAVEQVYRYPQIVEDILAQQSWRVDMVDFISELLEGAGRYQRERRQSRNRDRVKLPPGEISHVTVILELASLTQHDLEFSRSRASRTGPSSTQRNNVPISLSNLTPY